MDNKQISKILQQIGDILEIRGDDKFRVIAYRNAALGVLNYPGDLRSIYKNNPDEIEKIPGVGKNIKKYIIELIENGDVKEFIEIRKSIPIGLLEILEVRGIGPKKVKLFYTDLGVDSVKKLKDAAESGMIATLPGMGEKSQKEILGSLEERSKFQLDRVMINEALIEAENFVEYMEKCPAVVKIEYAGSLRRRMETIGDIDLLATTKNNNPDDISKIMSHFVKYGDVLKILSEGKTKSQVVLESGIQVDLRVVENNVFGAALHYFTGSKNHNILIRDMAKKQGLKVSEYGVFKRDTNDIVACKSEEDLFKSLGLAFIPPELRNGEDEIEYAMKNKKFPKLIELGDIKGDLHMHSVYSDGRNTVEEMAIAYQKLGFEYIAMTDHSAAMGIVGGMDKNKIRKQWKEIDLINKKSHGFKILKGSEVDILKDGSLDFEEEILKELDIVVVSAHMHSRLDFEEQTKRMIRAIENPYSKILGHPTGRMINKRAPMDFDMIKVINACKDNNVVIEINSNPIRLDLIDKYVRVAKDKGVKIAINTDSHDIFQPELLKYGVFVGRRGMLTKNDVLNSYSLEQVLNFWKD